MRGGALVVVDVTRRTVAYGRPAGGTRLQRLGALLLLVPALLLMLTLTTILFVVLLLVAAFIAAALALPAFFLQRRLSRAR
jgi:hypothetical protein